MDVSRCILVLDTSISATSNLERREYFGSIIVLLSHQHKVCIWEFIRGVSSKPFCCSCSVYTSSFEYWHCYTASVDLSWPSIPFILAGHLCIKIRAVFTYKLLFFFLRNKRTFVIKKKRTFDLETLLVNATQVPLWIKCLWFCDATEICQIINFESVLSFYILL